MSQNLEEIQQRLSSIRGLGDIVGAQRLRRQEQQRVDLAHGAIDAPAAAHFAKVQDEALGLRGNSHLLR